MILQACSKIIMNNESHSRIKMLTRLFMKIHSLEPNREYLGRILRNITSYNTWEYTLFHRALRTSSSPNAKSTISSLQTLKASRKHKTEIQTQMFTTAQGHTGAKASAGTWQRHSSAISPERSFKRSVIYHARKNRALSTAPKPFYWRLENHCHFLSGLNIKKNAALTLKEPLLLSEAYGVNLTVPR